MSHIDEQLPPITTPAEFNESAPYKLNHGWRVILNVADWTWLRRSSDGMPLRKLRKLKESHEH